MESHTTDHQDNEEFAPADERSMAMFYLLEELESAIKVADRAPEWAARHGRNFNHFEQQVQELITKLERMK